jgi:hypothetical protein
VVRPWLKLTGEVNHEVFEALKRRLFFAITRNPALRKDKLLQLLPIVSYSLLLCLFICIERLFSLFDYSHLSPVAVEELLESLEKEGKIFHRFLTYEPPSLFSTFDVPWATQNSNTKTQQQIFFATKE